MFGIISFSVPATKECLPVLDAPRVIEGLDILKQVCPVNPLTGKRASILEALGSVTADPKKRYLVDDLIRELPTIRNNPDLDDEGRIMALAERLETGTPSEDARVAERLSEISSILFRGAPQAVKDVTQSLEETDSAPATETASVSE